MVVLKQNKTENTVMEEPTRFTDEGKSLPSTQGTEAELRLELRCSDFQPQEHPCRCAVWASKWGSGGFALLL